jgi:hypothetical protein
MMVIPVRTGRVIDKELILFSFTTNQSEKKTHFVFHFSRFFFETSYILDEYRMESLTMLFANYINLDFVLLKGNLFDRIFFFIVKSRTNNFSANFTSEHCFMVLRFRSYFHFPSINLILSCVLMLST